MGICLVETLLILFISVNNQEFCFFCYFSFISIFTSNFFYPTLVLFLYPIFCICSVVPPTAFSNATSLLLYPLLAEQEQQVLGLVWGCDVLMGWLVCLCWLASTQNSHGLSCHCLSLHRNPHLDLHLCATTVFYGACRI